MYLLVIEISYFTLINKKRKRKKKTIKEFFKRACPTSGVYFVWFFFCFL